MCSYMDKGEYNHNSQVIAFIWTRVIMMMIMKIESFLHILKILFQE